MEVKGIPPRSLLAISSRRKLFFDENYKPIIEPNSRGKVRRPGGKDLEKMLDCEDPNFVDFIHKCIEWKVEHRLTPEQGFQHPWIKEGIKELKMKVQKSQQ